MAKDYTGNAATAKRLVEKFGRAVTVYKRSRTPADAGKPWQGPTDTPADFATFIAVFVPAAGGGLGKILVDKAAELDVTITQEVILSPESDLTFDLNDADSILDGGRAYKVHVREELKPGDLSLLFVLGVTG